ncbi:hypothetical protein PP175_26815 (plasmid) [Aneurinibacillus sp. Ricciae_BoGa-3]|uniref:hypothetical protein n=1 Tax=Aneurinibacillus sp. Ricciae_BoGa-3 TaxID=3022697 RepID=UPI002340A0BD|nr:hypothetical protein [Aneurinibacillus sp. Ricciae_BoGa-3]WCK57650.1 hypothetical protein PP175_26815 [Aneurinibacillus sp. Ricciae_BoGa-3]
MNTSWVQLLGLSLIEMLYLVGALIGVGFLLGELEKRSNAYLGRAFGQKAILATAWIGTPIHENGHLFQCFVWRHRVTKVRWLQLNDPNGVLGFVEHSYNRLSLYQRVGNFFIGIGPIFSGIASLILCMYLLVPHSYETFKNLLVYHVTSEAINLNFLKMLGVSMMAIAKSLFTVHNLMNPLFWLFIYLAVCISSHIALSKADIKGATGGLITIYILIVLFNLVATQLHLNSYNLIVSISTYNAYVLAFSSIAVLFSFITFVISFVLYQVKMR